MSIDPYLVGRAITQFPQAGATPLTLGRPGLRAKSAAHAAFTAAQQHLANLSAASGYDDPEIAADLKHELRDALTAQLRARTSAQFSDPLNGFVRLAERAHEEAQAAAEKHRPKLDPESAAQLIRTDQAWNNHIRPMLEAGKGWDQIIPTLNVDGLLAAERFAAGYEAAKRGREDQHEVPVVVAEIRASSERRLPDVVSPEAREALREAQDTAAALEYTRRASSAITQADGRDAAAWSIHLKRGVFEAGVQNPVDTSPEAQAAYQSSLQGPAAA